MSIYFLNDIHSALSVCNKGGEINVLVTATINYPRNRRWRKLMNINDSVWERIWAKSGNVQWNSLPIWSVLKLLPVCTIMPVLENLLKWYLSNNWSVPLLWRSELWREPFIDIVYFSEKSEVPNTKNRVGGCIWWAELVTHQLEPYWAWTHLQFDS